MPHSQSRRCASPPRSGLPATYDAYYLALAKRYDAALWTADNRLRKRLEGSGLRVEVLSDNLV